jgi:hypothetical protein
MARASRKKATISRLPQRRPGKSESRNEGTPARCRAALHYWQLGSGRGETCLGPARRSARFEFGKRGEDAEDQLAGWGGRINGGTVTDEDFEANTLLCQIVHRINQMTQVAAESIEFPDHQSIARAKGFERGIKAGASIQRPEARSS